MRLRLLLSLTLVVLLAIGSMYLAARSNAANEVRSFMYRGGMMGALGLVGELENYYAENGRWDGVRTLLTTWTPGHGAGMMGQGMMNSIMSQRLQLADAEGKIVADSEVAKPTSSLTADQRAGSIELMRGSQIVGYLYPEGGAAVNPAAEAQLVNRLNTSALTAALVAGGVSLLLALFLAYGLLRPVRALTLASQKLAGGDLSQRVQARGSDELAALGQTFNHMADSLQQAEAARRALTADIAHELRNPLAVQRASLEALQDGVYPLTPENLQPIIEQNQLLNRLVEDLRTLALADAGQIGLERVSTDFAALAGRVIERFRPQAASRQIQIHLETLSQPLPALSLDPMRIEQILNNLLANALRHTPEGGRVECSVASGSVISNQYPVTGSQSPAVGVQRSAVAGRPSPVVFTIHDSGSGIPAEALPHVFERFYRADRGRSRADGGSGLGLAIARKLAEAHGGTLEAGNHAQGGAVFTLRLPAG